MDIKKLSDKELQDKIKQLYFAIHTDYDLCSDLILEGLDRDNGFAKSIAADALFYEDHGFQKNINLSWKYACEAHRAGILSGAITFGGHQVKAAAEDGCQKAIDFMNLGIKQ